MTHIRLHNKTYRVESDGFFSAAETRELISWIQGHPLDVAAFLSNVSLQTVKSHRRALREKTGQHNGIGVLTYCLVNGYIRPSDTDSPTLQRRHQLMFSLRAANKLQELSHGAR